MADPRNIFSGVRSPQKVVGSKLYSDPRVQLKICRKWWRQSSKYGRNSPTIFDWGDDIPFLAKLRLYLQNQGVDPADTTVDPQTGKWWRQIKDVRTHGAYVKEPHQKKDY
ncbi:hypothetical protein RhiirC2_712328 [Rhizophagus irregularis]|uniref:Uncharacterized protein n=1 Tax=Rhizophagus irregularis TaxID=588596 RepID=A0A2N1N7G2_9GLOM|nr:hypothetical protein RhiirC2_712328 [Rhizophagus irregularis]